MEEFSCCCSSGSDVDLDLDLVGAEIWTCCGGSFVRNDGGQEKRDMV